MRVAMPITNNVLSVSFEHCDQFAIYTLKGGKITKKELLINSETEPELIPDILENKGVTDVIANKITTHTIAILNTKKMNVFIGVTQKYPKGIIQDFLNGCLSTKDNTKENETTME